jgi:hypothetical protein
MFKYFVFLLLLSSCGLFSGKKNPREGVRNLRIDAGEKGLKRAEDLYENNYYQKAIDQIESLETKYQSTYLEPEYHFLKGKSYLQMTELDKAEDSFRAAYHLWTRSEAGRAKSLYYLALVYEQQNQDDKMIASLLELKSLPNQLQERVYKLDIPAKLSSAYSREDNLKEAKRYSEIMEAYLKKHVANKKLPSESLNLVAKSLFEIADNSLKNWESRDFEEKLDSLKYSQFYLLRAIEMGVSPWAEKAMYLYEQSYRELLDYILSDWTNLYYQKNKVSARRDQKRKLRQLEKISHLLREIEKKQLPKGVIKHDIYNRFLLVNKAYNKEIEIYYLEPEVGEGLTDAAKKLLGMKKEIRGLKPKQLLKKYRKQIQLPVKDPNL